MIYTDYAATSYPKPQRVVDGVMRFFSDYGANPGRSGHDMALATSRKIFEARMCINEFFHGDSPLQWAFCQNGSEALNMAILGTLTSSDHAICTSMDHNSVLRPLHELEQQGMKLTVVQADKEGIVSPEEIEKAITEKTKLIVTTHASNLVGTIQDIERIAKIAQRKGILYLVDAAQTAGFLEIDLSAIPISFLAITGHKSLLGPQGIGALYVKPGCTLFPRKMGGTGSQSNELFQPRDMPDLLEVGTPNTLGILGLAEGIRYVQDIGLKDIQTKEKMLFRRFLKALTQLEGYEVYGTKDEEKSAPVVALNHECLTSSELSQILNEKYHIATRPGLHCAPLAHQSIGTLEKGATRFSFGYSNTEEEIDCCIMALKEIHQNVKEKRI